MLIERVRRALAPEYEIQGEIAGGGMGIVFAARQLRLNRKVAIKILRPEQATAVGVERFLSEGRLLARLDHPNIVPVYDAGEADGLLYYVMQFVEGETLHDRLGRGPLEAREAERLAADLLAGLSAAHQLGIVHRDVKPANVFLRGGSALLGDFGIARVSEGEGAGHTTPGEQIGTLRYMAPEQRDGSPATPRSDVYAVGLVLWEACSGSHWPAYQEPGRADWRRLPPTLVSGVRRALELDPERRWNDAQEFRAAIAQPARRLRWLAGAAVLILGLGVAGYELLRPRGPPPTRALLTLAIPSFVVTGAGLSPALGDSAARHLRSLLSGYPDFSVLPVSGRSRDPRTLELTGALSLSGGRLRMTVQENGGAAHGGQLIAAADSGAEEQWRGLTRSVAAALVLPIWIRAAGDGFFPSVNVIPADDSDRAQFVKAEQFFSLGQWEDARDAYQAVGGTCLLCWHRLLDIARWFGLPRDIAMDLVLRHGESSFPEYYRPLIHALSTPMPARLDTLELASNAWSGFFLASFELADELIHRGPLYGRLRSEALGPLEQTLLVRPHFVPALEHMAWMLIAEGDSAGARQALDTLQSYSSRSGLSQALASLRELGYHWRFVPLDSARQFSEWLMQQPEVQKNLDAEAGPRLLMTMDAPLGAFELGGMFTRWKGRQTAVPGLLAQLFASAALGWLDSLTVIRERLSHVTAEPAYSLLALELEAVLRAFDPDSAVRYGGEAAAELTRLARRLSADAALSARTYWALGVLAAGRQDTAGLLASRTALGRMGADPALLRILDALALGPADPRGALELLNEFRALDVVPRRTDPLEHAVVQLLRAAMQQRLDSVPAALRTLRWHEHTQLLGHLRGPPQAGELDWALGTLARWKRRELLASQGVTDAEWCVINAALARHWAAGDSVYRTRAAKAVEAFTQPACR